MEPSDAVLVDSVRVERKPKKKGALDWRNFVADEGSTAEERGVRDVPLGALKIQPRQEAGAPMETDDSLSQSDFEAALAHKQRGNAAFKRGDWQAAVDAYGSALESFGEPPGSIRSSVKTLTDEQRGEKVTVLSNNAEALLKMDELLRARDACDAALQLNPAHSKSLYRRARAFRHLGPWMGGGAALGAAATDLRALQALGSSAGDELLEEVERCQASLAAQMSTPEGAQVSAWLEEVRAGHGLGADGHTMAPSRSDT